MLVEAKGLTVAFSGTPAVRDISFGVARGERFGIIGESGSGKTLTALALAGLLPDTARMSGEIAFEGAPLPRTEAGLATIRGRRIGFVFQEPMTALNPLMRVGDQIGEGIALHGLASDVPARVSDLLEEVGLPSALARRFPHQLSGGQRQRIMIAMALAGEPDLLIADEPTSALDLVTQQRVLGLLDTVSARRGTALILISHDLKAVASLCTRIAVLRRGEMVETGSAEALFEAPKSPYTSALVAASRPPALPPPPPVEGPPILVGRGITRRFAHGGTPFRRDWLAAVDHVDIAVGVGETVALVGPSGCGKSTLARMIVGLDRPDAGRFAFEGRPYPGPLGMPRAVRRQISLVFQDPFGSFDPRLSVGASVGEPLGLLNLPAAERAERVGTALEAVGLSSGMAARYPHEFSGGQRQRLAIARALVTRPKLVVLDEPVSALDVSVRSEVLALLHRLRAQYGLAYVLISHDLDMVRALAHRILVMEAGAIVEQNTPDALFADPRHPLTRALLEARLAEPGEVQAGANPAISAP